MTQDERRQDNDDGDARSLNSTEYRHRLLNKLNCLIAVLEVAIGKITKSIASEDANHDRLARIKSNLENTLAICRRAKGTLETKLLADEGGQGPAEAAPASGDKLSFRCYVELSSIDEFRKFKDLPAITDQEIRATDLDALADQLLDED